MIWDMFNRPDAYLNDWYGYATNQIGHIFVGVVAFAVLACLLKLLFKWADWEDDHKEMALMVLGVGYAVWEAMQLMAGAMLSDAVEDWLFVMGGGVLGYAIWAGMRRLSASVIIAGMLAILAGSNQRRKK